MRQRILYTREDGKVSVVIPVQSVFTAMRCGGGLIEADQRKRQIHNFSHDLGEDLARRWVDAVCFGGLSTQEAWALFRDKHVPAEFCRMAELVDVTDIPSDRWFRDAWRRSANGGPITISLDAAKPIHFRNLRSAAEASAKMRQTDIDAFDTQDQTDWFATRELIKRAKCVEELRAIRPRLIEGAQHASARAEGLFQAPA